MHRLLLPFLAGLATVPDSSRPRLLSAHAIGLDFSSTQVELARATFAGIEFRQGDAEQLPFDANTFEP